MLPSLFEKRVPERSGWFLLPLFFNEERGTSAAVRRQEAGEPESTMVMKRAVRILFMLSVPLAVVPFGSVQSGWLLASCFFSTLVFVLALFRPVENPGWRLPFATTAVLVVVLGLWAVLQAVRVPNNPFADPAWNEVSNLLGATASAISVDPATTLGAIPQLLTPFLVFLTVPLLYNRDSRLERLWTYLAFFGGAVAVFSILQFAFFPDFLLWGEKRYYDGSLTATFVNRNTAGTFLAISSIMNFGLGMRSLAQLRRSGDLQRFIRGHLTVRAGRLALISLAFISSLSGVFLTQSRGAVLVTLAGLLVAGLLFAVPYLAGRRWNLRTTVAAGVVVVLAVVLFAAFAGRASRRLELAGVDESRLCTFKSVWAAIMDHPVFGTGFGTFEQVFPAYRNESCDGINGVWYHAHNSYLEGYLGMGAIFALVTIVGLVALVSIFVTGMRDRRSFRFAPASALGILTAVCLHALVDFSLQIQGIAIYVAAVLGTGAALSLGKRREWSDRIGSETDG